MKCELANLLIASHVGGACTHMFLHHVILKKIVLHGIISYISKQKPCKSIDSIACEGRMHSYMFLHHVILHNMNSYFYVMQ